MKAKLYFLLFILCTTGVFAQHKSDKIKTLKIAYITEKLDLTKAEAEKFWPVYNTFDEKDDAIRDTMRNQRKNSDLDTLSESEAKSLLNDMLASNEKRHQLFTQYIKDLQRILPAKKIILLKKTEDDFRRKMFEEFKKRNPKKD